MLVAAVMNSLHRLLLGKSLVGSNVDGSVSKNNTKAAIGGAMQNLDGEWLMSFNMVEINCDNVMLIDTICNGFASISNIAEVRLIHEWCNKDWKVNFRHVLRGSNKVADCLAKTAIGKLNQVVLFLVPPQYVIRLLEEDTHDSLHE
ncbi:hypothetical protein Gogos_005420 [Gossypium gossypioides]|uniref:RNase H type-1 domain-containing protein n=1 Tax=Gossypium gossypioides TaxID=34282 RepID=A0A7J9CZP4_GOSGO|nr:hypothetical protein [Gossypium gossypioides]